MDIETARPSLPPVPLDVADTGLSQSLLEDLVARTLMEVGTADLPALARSTCLSSKLLDTLIDSLRRAARVELHSPLEGDRQLRYALTDAGRAYAREARERSTYTGPAPLAAEHYQRLIRRQTSRPTGIDRAAMQAVYEDVILDPVLMDRLGAAMNSGRAMFIYGPAGTGKTFVCKRLVELLDDPVYIPHAVAIGDSIVKVYDAAVHVAIETDEIESALIADQPDPRLVLCRRPFVCSGGELTADMLEISLDQQSRQFTAPLQLKATHGIFMIDDLGRQRMPTGELFNRWIVPMESREDFLGLPSGQRLMLPFDVLLVFSTNLDPSDLEDPAFQRRVGHKIRFEPVSPAVFSALWNEECARLGVTPDPELTEYVIRDCFQADGRPLLASQPRDLIGMALDFSRYANEGAGLTPEGLRLAWENYACSSGETFSNV